MSSSDHLGKFEDPLLSGLQDSKAAKNRSRRADRRKARESAASSGHPFLITGLLLITALGVLGYFLYQAQKNIDSLSLELARSRGVLSEVKTELEESQSEIGALNSELEKSKQKIRGQDQKLSQYRGVVEGLKSHQENQSREIQTLAVQKANQSEVDNLKSDTTQLHEKTDRLDQDLDQARSSISGLEQTAAGNRIQIDQTRSQLELVRGSVDANRGEIGEIKRSLEREYYNFELQENGGYMKVLNVSLSLKDTDVRRRQFDLYLLADGKVIRKKDHPVNTPILFYVEGKKKPYEVVITRVERKLVVGYLSVPKV